MTDKTREVYKETADTMPTLNPFVDMPRMRVSAVNALNEIIERATMKPMVKYTYEDGSEKGCCPNCDKVLLEGDDVHYCPFCGQCYDSKNYGL